MSVSMYLYEAGLHCPECAKERFGAALEDESAVDSEGNPVGVVMSWELQTGDYCDDCLTLATEPIIREQVPFVEWLISNLDGEDLRLIDREGCVAGIPGLITYGETTPLYDAFNADVWEGVVDRGSACGKTVGEVLGDIGDNVMGHDQFAQAMVWAAVEWYRDLVEEERAYRQIVR